MSLDPVPLSVRMQGRLDLYRAEPAVASRRFWEEPGLTRRYPGLLLLQLDVIRASADLMEEAARLLETGSREAWARGLAAYFRHHAEEERGHVAWVREDLGVLGIPAETLASRVPSPHAAALTGAQYYWMRHAHPVALLGHLVALEWVSPDPTFFDAAADRSGLPREAFSTFRRHAQLDPGHRRELAEMLDGLALTDAQEALLGVSLLHACQGVAGLYRAALAD
ncbi:MAG TPA: iron-containing redox enzyme family protein [Holophagaceae bacterium]|nr:iron-containing redox enzyme family protein [Holophagaceae bacterium]